MVKKKTDKEKRWVKKRGKKLEKLTWFLKLNPIRKWLRKIGKVKYTPAGIRTRVRALATPGDDRYTTDVLWWCPDPDSNRGQLPLQGSALPLSYLGRQINLIYIWEWVVAWFSFSFFTFRKNLRKIFKWARWDSNSGPPPCQGDVITV